MKSSSKKDTFSSTISPSKKDNKARQKLAMNGKLTLRKYDLNMTKLVSKARCAVTAKNIKNSSKNKSRNLSQDVSVRSIRDKSLSRDRRDTSFEQVNKVTLEGAFKDKMITLVKIFEAEKK